MKLKELVNKIESLNKLNNELGITNDSIKLHFTNESGVETVCSNWEEVKKEVDYETYKDLIDDTTLNQLEKSTYELSIRWKITYEEGYKEFVNNYKIEIY